MEESIISISHLAKNYGSFQAVRDVNITVNKGDVYGILGPNGAGKSTTIRCMLSLINASSGNIRLFGHDIKTHRKEALSKIGCIVEKPDFYKYLSAESNLAIFGRIAGADVSKINIHKMLSFVGLQGREKDKVSGFSHGMKQRLGIAQTLLHNPDLIILDEPTTGLDPQGIIDIRNLILDLKNEFHKTVVLSSHILSEIELIANRMVIINKGVSVVEGSVNELLQQEELIVAMEVSDAEKSMQLLANHPAIQKIDQFNISITIDKNEIPNCIDTLSKGGILVYNVSSKRKLEDYFLKLINQ
jgi:ABC-type multidrug transport system ATPase subunit